MILGFLESVNNYMTDYSKEILAVEKASINQLTEVVRYPSLVKEAIPFQFITNSVTELAAELTFAAQSSAPNDDRIFESARIGPVITFIIVGIALLNPSEITLGRNNTASTMPPMRSNTFFAPLQKKSENSI